METLLMGATQPLHLSASSSDEERLQLLKREAWCSWYETVIEESFSARKFTVARDKLPALSVSPLFSITVSADNTFQATGNTSSWTLCAGIALLDE